MLVMGATCSSLSSAIYLCVWCVRWAVLNLSQKKKKKTHTVAVIGRFTERLRCTPPLHLGGGTPRRLELSLVPTHTRTAPHHITRLATDPLSLPAPPAPAAQGEAVSACRHADVAAKHVTFGYGGWPSQDCTGTADPACLSVAV